MTIHSSILNWKILGTEEPCRLHSREVVKNQTQLSDSSHAHTIQNSGFLLQSQHQTSSLSNRWHKIVSGDWSSDQLFYGLMLAAQSCLTLCDSMDCSLCPWNSPGQNTGVGCHSLLQGIFLTQRSNPCLPHCRADSLPSEPSGKPLAPIQIPIDTLHFSLFEEILLP